MTTVKVKARNILPGDVLVSAILARNAGRVVTQDRKVRAVHFFEPSRRHDWTIRSAIGFRWSFLDQTTVQGWTTLLCFRSIWTTWLRSGRTKPINFDEFASSRIAGVQVTGCLLTGSANKKEVGSQ